MACYNFSKIMNVSVERLASCSTLEEFSDLVEQECHVVAEVPMKERLYVITSAYTIENGCTYEALVHSLLNALLEEMQVPYVVCKTTSLDEDCILDPTKFEGKVLYVWGVGGGSGDEVRFTNVKDFVASFGGNLQEYEYLISAMEDDLGPDVYVEGPKDLAFYFGYKENLRKLAKLKGHRYGNVWYGYKSAAIPTIADNVLSRFDTEDELLNTCVAATDGDTDAKIRILDASPSGSLPFYTVATRKGETLYLEHGSGEARKYFGTQLAMDIHPIDEAGFHVIDKEDELVPYIVDTNYQVHKVEYIEDSWGEFYRSLRQSEYLDSVSNEIFWNDRVETAVFLHLSKYEPHRFKDYYKLNKKVKSWKVDLTLLELQLFTKAGFLCDNNIAKLIPEKYRRK